MNIRENMINTAQPGKQKELFEKFWEEYDKLWIDIETIPTYKECRKRFSEMYYILFEGCEITGDYHLITLWGLENKINTIYSEEERKQYNHFEREK